MAYRTVASIVTHIDLAWQQKLDVFVAAELLLSLWRCNLLDVLPCHFRVRALARELARDVERVPRHASINQQTAKMKYDSQLLD